MTLPKVPNILRGKPVATAMEEALQRDVLHRQLSLQLVIIMVGSHPASETYVGKKLEAAQRVGIKARLDRLDASVTQTALHEHLQKLNEDQDVTGYILQLPLPDHLSLHDAVQHFSPAKDVDGFTASNAGELFLGSESALLPATSHAVVDLLDFYQVDVAGKHVVIIGRSNLVGKPLAIELLHRDATVTICHSRTPDLATFTQMADIVVSATGRKHLVTAAMVREGVVLIDVGFSKTADGLFGDINPEAHAKAAAYAPVPGGVGAVTVAQLIANVLRAHDLSHA